jgi:GNAT superfamily N-acetyltransferase
MAFCTTRVGFALGWLTGGNRRRFESVARSDTSPMGVLAYAVGQPVGWCACGPRRRYIGASGDRGRLVVDPSPDQDEVVWFVACLFVRKDWRGRGVTHELVRAAVDLAASSGAVAIEAWPQATSTRRVSENFLGRQEMFEQLGFHLVSSLAPGRCIVRRELAE